jgi:hypothetical protein
VATVVFSSMGSCGMVKAKVRELGQNVVVVIDGGGSGIAICAFHQNQSFIRCTILYAAPKGLTYLT